MFGIPWGPMELGSGFRSLAQQSLLALLQALGFHSEALGFWGLVRFPKAPSL